MASKNLHVLMTSTIKSPCTSFARFGVGTEAWELGLLICGDVCFAGRRTCNAGSPAGDAPPGLSRRSLTLVDFNVTAASSESFFGRPRFRLQGTKH
jgi:hypothetical protein